MAPDFRLTLAAVCAGWLGMGCTDITAQSDGGVDAGPATPDCLVAPAAPAAPVQPDWVCPPGWVPTPAFTLSAAEVTAGVAPPVNVCSPPPLPSSCPDGTRPALGSSRCQTVGDPCPLSDWADVPAGATVRYVKAGAVGGDGLTQATAFGTIAQALTASAAGTTIAIAKGRYTEYLQIARAVTLLGACASQTIVVAPTRSASQGTIDVGAAATLKNLQVTGPRVGVWVLHNPQPATLRGVIVHSAELVGIFVSDSGHAELTDVLVTQTLPDPADGTMGRGLQLRAGGQVTGHGVVFEKNRDVAVTLDGAGCSAQLEDLVVRDTASEQASRAYGQGMEVRSGASAAVVRGLFERNRNTHLVSDTPGTRVTLTDVVMQDSLPQENNGQYGGALELAAGVVAEVTRTQLLRSTSVALAVQGAGATFHATSLLVAQTAPRVADGQQGLGLAASLGARVDLQQSVFVGNHLASLLVGNVGTELDLDDVRVRQAAPQASDGSFGLGLIALDQATLNADRVSIERCSDSGVFLQTRAVAHFNDLTVRDSEPQSPMSVGEGLTAQSGAQVTVTRAWFDANQLAAVALDAASAQLTDLRITNTLAAADGRFGRGITIRGAASLAVLRAELSRTSEAAIHASEPNTTLSLDQVSVSDTQPSLQDALHPGRALSIEHGAVAEGTCVVATGNREVTAFAIGEGTSLRLTHSRLSSTSGLMDFADGLLARDGATATLEDCEVRGNSNVGVAFSNAQGTLSRTAISDNAVGLYVGEGAALAEVNAAGPPQTLQVQVDSACTFSGNATRVGSVAVPLPPAAGSAPSRPER